MEIFFGPAAVQANSRLLGDLIKKDEDTSEAFRTSDGIFEDEEDTWNDNQEESRKRQPSIKFQLLFFLFDVYLIVIATKISLFNKEDGYGEDSCESYQVLSLLGSHPPFFYRFLDRVVHKPKYTSDSGCVLGYIFHERLVRFVDAPFGGDNLNISDMKEKMAGWILDVLRSPLSGEFKSWFLHMSYQRYGAKPPVPERDEQGV